MHSIPWKPPAIIGIIPKYVSPDLTVLGPSGRPNPYRHYRRQLVDVNTNGNNISNKISISLLNGPGGSVLNNACKCNDTSKTTAIYSNISNNDICKSKSCPPPIIKSACTIVKKDYYQSSSNYLKSKRKTFSQNNGKGSSKNINNACCNNTVYKPNNPTFSNQGAVSCGSRLERLKLITIEKNASSFKSSYGSHVASAASYKANKEAPRMIKTINYVEKLKSFNKKYCC